MPKLNRETVIKSDDLNHGVYEWNPDVNYKLPALVFGPDGELYTASRPSFNINPATNDNYWEPIFKKIKEFVAEIQSSMFPIGGIIAWPSSRNFLGLGNSWLECNGEKFDKILCPDLYAVLNSEYVPDYRGHFLRGYGSCTSSNGKYGTTVHSSGNIGIQQTDAIRNIFGTCDTVENRGSNSRCSI